ARSASGLQTSRSQSERTTCGPTMTKTAEPHETDEIARANEPLHGRFAEPLPRIPLVWGPIDFEHLSDEISGITGNPQPAWWWPALLTTASLLLGGGSAATHL